MSEKVSIILPTYKTADLTIRCAEHIKTETMTPFEIIWIDDGSPDEAFSKMLGFFRKAELPFRHHRFNQNKGFAAAVNQGLRMATTRHVAILNNDVVVTHGWLGKLVAALDSSEKLGLVGAVTDNISSINRFDLIAKMKSYLIKDEPEKFFNALMPQTMTVGSNVSYFCVAIKRELVSKIGLLDERFYNGGEDDDYNDRIRDAGYETAVCLNCFVYHDHHATFSLIPEWPARRRQNVALLREKRALRTASK